MIDFCKFSDNLSENYHDLKMQMSWPIIYCLYPFISLLFHKNGAKKSG